MIIREPGHTLSFQWVPSHVGLEGNDGADALAEEGREQHPNNYEYISKHRQQGGRGMWEEVGPVEMSSDEVEPMEEGSSGRVSSQNSGTETDQETEYQTTTYNVNAEWLLDDAINRVNGLRKGGRLDGRVSREGTVRGSREQQ